MSALVEKYITHWDIATSPHWVTRLENGVYQSYHYTQEAADRNTAHLNELVKLRAAHAETVAKIMSLRASEHALQSENAALRKAGLALIKEIDVEAFYQTGQVAGEMLYIHVGPLRSAIDAARKEGGAL